MNQRHMLIKRAAKDSEPPVAKELGVGGGEMPHQVKPLSCKCKGSVQIRGTHTKLCKCICNPHAMTRQEEETDIWKGRRQEQQRKTQSQLLWKARIST